MQLDRRGRGLVAAACGVAVALSVAAPGPVGTAARLGLAAVAPGLALLALLPRGGEGGWGWTLIVAAALSPCLLSVPTLGAVLWAGWPLDRALGLCALAVSALLGAALWRAARGRAEPAGTAGAPQRACVLAMAPVALMIVLAVVVQLSPTTRLSYHGLLHADIVAQMASGLLPPESPAMAGEPLHYYWLYHWLLLVWGRIGGASLLVNSPILNTLSLAIYVAAGYRVARRFLTPGRAALASLAVGFATNLIFPILFLGNAALNGLPERLDWPFHLLGVGCLAGDPRLVTLLAKFYNMNGFPFGLALYSVLIAEMLPRERESPRHVVVFLLLCSTLLFHSAAAVAAYGALSLAHLSVSVAEFRRVSPAALVRANLPMAAVFLAALAVTAPYVLAASWGAGSLQRPRSMAESVTYGVGGVLLSATPLVPAVLFGALRGWRERAARFLTVAAGVLLVAGALLPLPDGNQYKLVHLSAFPGGALLFWLLRGEGSLGPRLRTLCLAGAVGLAVFSHGITAVAYLYTGSSRVERFKGDGNHLRRIDAPELDRALHWLREHTPVDAVVVSKPHKIGASGITAISGRGDFVMEALPHWRGERFAVRYGLAKALFSSEGAASSVIARMRDEIDRPLYVLLLRGWFPDDFVALQQKLDGAPELLTKVFRSEGAVVWAVRPR